VFVALLRGVNVGGNNLVSMKALKESFEGLRFKDVATYINSGNILFRSADADPRRLEDRIDRMLLRRHGLSGRTVVRSLPEIARLVKKISATWTPDPAWRYNVIFLRHAIDSKRVLDGVALEPDLERVVYCPGALLWSARVSALSRTAMLKLVRQPIYKDMTIRNVNTTTKILHLMQAMQQKHG
jgi:uncharacterized protein (DUF1697 family)